jgi:hypothetical protein
MLEMDYRKSSSACARIRCLISRAVYKTLIIHICTASFVYDTPSPPVRRICILHNIFDASGERENDEIERWLFWETRALAAEIRRMEQWSGAQPPQMQISFGAAERGERKFIS